MPCYRCGTRQTDPGKGPSPWKRGVRHGGMVLVCPDCQQDARWVDELDRCPSCGSTSLSRTLGDTRCKACGSLVETAGDIAAQVSGAPGLADEVAQALNRAFRRPDQA